MTKKIYIDAGHGGKDSGAVSAGFKEDDMTLIITKACRDYLEDTYKDIAVKLSRTTDVNPDLNKRCNEVNSWGADIAVSNHLNAGGGDGCEAWCSKGSNRAANLAKAILKEVKALGQNVHGSEVKTRTDSSGRDYFAFNRIPNCASPIIEFFFIDNATDRKIGDTDAKLKKLGIAEAKGIAAYLGLEKKETASKTETVNKSTSGHKIIEARNTEAGVGHYKNGKPGDQTGKEVYVGDFRYFGQQYVFRLKNEDLARILAGTMYYWAVNKNIGYDQNSDDRTTLWEYLADKCWRNPMVSKPVEGTCSDILSCGLRYIGIDAPKRMNTGPYIEWLKGRKEFEMIRDADMLKTGKGLKGGDIIIKDGHVAVCYK